MELEASPINIAGIVFDMHITLYPAVGSLIANPLKTFYLQSMKGPVAVPLVLGSVELKSSSPGIPEKLDGFLAAVHEKYPTLDLTSIDDRMEDRKEAARHRDQTNLAPESSSPSPAAAAASPPSERRDPDRVRNGGASGTDAAGHEFIVTYMAGSGGGKIEISYVANNSAYWAEIYRKNLSRYESVPQSDLKSGL